MESLHIPEMRIVTMNLRGVIFTLSLSPSDGEREGVRGSATSADARFIESFKI